jgi:CYTH domain-containing protein
VKYESNEQENYIIKKLKFVRQKIYQAYLVPFCVDFAFRMGAAVLADFVGAKLATIIGISLLTLTRIKALKDLFDVVKGLVETEKLHDPVLTIKGMFVRDTKALIHSFLTCLKFKNRKRVKRKGEVQTNSVSIVLGAIVPMLFDYFSMGIVAKYGAASAAITQVIDTMLHMSALLILYSNVKKVNEKLQKFNAEYYNQFKSFVNESLVESKPNFISRIMHNHDLKDVLDKTKTKYNPEKIRRFLISSKKIASVIKGATDSQEWEQFYLQFPNDHDYAERSIRKCGNKYMIITKVVETTKSNNKLGYPDSSRNTYTVEITEKRYKEFLKLNGENPIYKLTSYTIPINKGQMTILLDVYKDMYKGLNIARVKFKDPRQSSKFVIPSWFGEEITNDPNYTGKHFPSVKK